MSTTSASAHEGGRALFGTHPDVIAADRIRDVSGCVLRDTRTVLRPVLDGAWPPAE